MAALAAAAATAAGCLALLAAPGGARDRRWDDESLERLKRIPGRAFEIVRSRARPHVC